MTNEELIKFGKEQLEIFGEDSRMSEFIRLAIQAFEERPKGKWIVYKDNYGNDKPVCSCCNKEQIGYANYCSNCGADMRGDV